MPTSTIWLKIGNADVRVLKQKVGNALLIKDPELVTQADGKPVNDVRVVSQCQWIRHGTGELLTVETTLKDAKGEPVPISEGMCILQHHKGLVLDEKANEIDKKKIQYFLLNPDGSTGEQVAPYPPTERIEVKEDASEVKEQGDAYWIPSTVMESFLIQEEYELPAADPRNDIKLWKEAEDTAKRDEIAITTYSNGGFTQYYAFLVPYLIEGKFEWKLRISNKKVEHRCLRDIPAPTKIPIREVRTLETLPPIQALLTIPTAKKKKQ